MKSAAFELRANPTRCPKWRFRAFSRRWRPPFLGTRTYVQDSRHSSVMGVAVVGGI